MVWHIQQPTAKGFAMANRYKKQGDKAWNPNETIFHYDDDDYNEDGTLKVEGCLAFICDGEEWQPLIVKIKEDGTKEAILKNSPRNN